MTLEAGQNVVSKSGRFEGQATVVQVRTVAGVSQAIVEVTGSGELLTIKLDDLEEARDVAGRLTAQLFDASTTYDVRAQACFLDLVNRRTAALSAIRVEMVPHQVLTADKILTATNPNHLIADDVGMGKTIEVGLIIKALDARQEAKRILIVVPAGLTVQWQEQMLDIFGLYFDVFNRDFFDQRPDAWQRHHRVIASLDALKLEKRRTTLEEAPDWDVLVVDEAHKLTARLERDETIRRTQNYMLIEQMAPKARTILFATATPHQGDDARFSLLLNLLREDLFDQRDPLGSLDRALPALERVMTRNRKSDATDKDGNPLFKGHRVVPVDVTPSEHEEEFLQELQQYVLLAYGSAEHMERKRALVLALVMTTFLKLASSSPAAIHSALSNRLRYLETGKKQVRRKKPERETDLRFSGEDDEAREEIVATPAFFEEEAEHLRTLVSLASGLGRGEKAARFLDEVTTLKSQPDFKGGVLIFTEYRSTQKLITAALKGLFPNEPVNQIHGEMSLNQKRVSVRALNQHGGFVVSTEAGGEGLNMQENCHVMFNFDLPWNPMRLQQRIGRLDRFNQPHKVVVFNLRTVGTIENRIRVRLEEKLAAARRALEAVQENPEDLHEAILGNLEEEIDLASIYRKIVLSPGTEGQTGEEIDRALDRAKRAAQRASRLFAAMGRFTPADWTRVEPEASLFDVEIWTKAYFRRRKFDETSPGVYSLKTPEHVSKRKAKKRQYDAVVFDRDLAKEIPEAELFTFGHAVFDACIQDALSLHHGGQTTRRVVAAPSGVAEAVGLQLNYILTLRFPDGRECKFPKTVFIDQEHNLRPDLASLCQTAYSTPARARIHASLKGDWTDKALQLGREDAEESLASLAQQTEQALPSMELFSAAMVQVSLE